MSSLNLLPATADTVRNGYRREEVPQERYLPFSADNSRDDHNPMSQSTQIFDEYMAKRELEEEEKKFQAENDNDVKNFLIKEKFIVDFEKAPKHPDEYVKDDDLDEDKMVGSVDWADPFKDDIICDFYKPEEIQKQK